MTKPSTAILRQLPRPLSAGKRQQVFVRLAETNPTPRTELEYQTPFQLLIAVILSAQSTDRAVNRCTRPLFAITPTPSQMLALGETGLTPYIQTLGLFRNKAKHIIATCELLQIRHGGEVPEDRAALEALPGVGRKTANVILNTVFRQPTMAVDTHIFRLANRLRLAPGKTPLAVERGLLRNVPKEFALDAHHWLILHGRYVCKARRPECWRCILQDLCPFSDKTPVPE